LRVTSRGLGDVYKRQDVELMMRIFARILTLRLIIVIRNLIQIISIRLLTNIVTKA
jgi:hypothetical protein